MTARYTDNGTNDRPDWSAMLPFIVAARAALEKPGQLAIAERNRAQLAAAYPDVELTEEAGVHYLMHRLIMVVGREIAVLSLVPLVPEDVH